MHFDLPHGSNFELPDEWIGAVGFAGFQRRGDYFSFRPDHQLPDLDVLLVPARSIQPPQRSPGVTLDYGGFRREKMVGVLERLMTDAPMEPIRVRANGGEFAYTVHDGFHRFYGSVAAAFPMVPVVVHDWFAW